MAHNLQQRAHLVPPNVAHILNESTNRWLHHDELMELFLEWRNPQLQISAVNPPNLIPGLYFFNRPRFRDGNQWTDVNQPRRRNCVPVHLPTEVLHRVGCTEASAGNFFPRTHHVWDLDAEEAPLVQIGDSLTIVHYLVVDGGVGDGGGEGDGGDGGDEGDGDGEGGGDDEGDGHGEGGGGDDDEEDDQAQDHDYVPDSEEEHECDSLEPPVNLSIFTSKFQGQSLSGLYSLMAFSNCF